MTDEAIPISTCPKCHLDFYSPRLQSCPRCFIPLKAKGTDTESK